MVTSVASMISQFNIPNIKLLIEQGYEVTVATNFENPGNIPIKESTSLIENLTKMGVECIDIPFSRSPINKMNLKCYKLLLNLIKNNNYNLIHCQSPVGGVITRLAAKKAIGKVIYTAHGFHFFKGAPLKNWIIFYPIEKFLSRYTDVLITINNEDYSIAKKNFYAKNVVKINGIGLDIDKFENIKIDENLKRKSIDISIDSFIILSVGEINSNKNHKVIIKAIERLKNSEIHYVICGEGQDKEELILLSKKLKIENQIHFLGYRSDIVEICYVADIFAFPSHREGLGMAALEAMATGLPIISSNVHGINDYSINGLTGFSHNPDDVDGFSKSIKILYENTELRKKMSLYNKDYVKKYSVNSTMKQMKKIYKPIYDNKKF